MLCGSFIVLFFGLFCWREGVFYCFLKLPFEGDGLLSCCLVLHGLSATLAVSNVWGHVWGPEGSVWRKRQSDAPGS